MQRNTAELRGLIFHPFILNRRICLLVVNLAGDPSGWEGLTVIEKVDGGGQMAPASHTVNGLEESLTIGVANQGVKIVFAYNLYREVIVGSAGMNGLMIDAISSICLCAKSNL